MKIKTKKPDVTKVASRLAVDANSRNAGAFGHQGKAKLRHERRTQKQLLRQQVGW